MQRIQFKHLTILFLLFSFVSVQAEDGYQLWLRYMKVSDPLILASYRKTITSWHVDLQSQTGDVIRKELRLALPALLGVNVNESSSEKYSLLVTTLKSPKLKSLGLASQLTSLNNDGYIIKKIKHAGEWLVVVAGVEQQGALYGVYHLLRLLQTQQSIETIDVTEEPKTKIRILNHWDNLDRTVERGYAGSSIFDWHKLPGYIDQRYHDYARANASIGINGTVLTNVNANALVLTDSYLQKVKALADVFRPYGIKVYLTARFNAPMELDGLATADPLDPNVKQWWEQKAKTIYNLIPDFGGFVVKANSEGQPGPQTYGRNHAEGANLLANALKPFGGIVMWRAFVYDNNDKTDRAKQAFNEFQPLDGLFADNVIVQVKNGPIDFQPREPFHPLFGAMPKTPLSVEFQITQEYLGFATHLAYLGPLLEETLKSDTYAPGIGSSVARVVDGSLYNNRQLASMAGVANIGSDRNWCGHPFAQANWFAFGRLSWNHTLGSADIAEQWIRMTFSNDDTVVKTCLSIMMPSRESVVNYMTPLGLHHIMGWDHHYGPAPWIANKPRADWTSVYYHRADSNGIGFDRTKTGSDAVGQYAPKVANTFTDIKTCPDQFLLWFHHVPWDYKMRTGRTLWDELCARYDAGFASIATFEKQWNSLENKIDQERFTAVKSLLSIQHQEALWWRNACLLYFQEFSKKPFPKGFVAPNHTLEYYKALEFPFAPGIRPKW